MFQRRLDLIYLCLCAGLAIIGVRLAAMQFYQRTIEDPDAVLLRPLPLDDVPAARGRILDRAGVVLAEDSPDLALQVDYRELLLLHYMCGGEIEDAERIQLRKYERARVLAARKESAANLQEIETIYKSLGDPADTDSVRALPQMALAKLATLSAITQHSEADLLNRVEDIVGKVRRIKRSLPKIRIIYEETIAHELLPEVSVEAATYLGANSDLFPGFSIDTRHTRRYPRGVFAPHVIGEMGKAPRPRPGEAPDDPNVRPGERAGISGVEKQFNVLLRGEPGIFNESVDEKTNVLTREVLFPARPGADLYLSIDAAAQKIAEDQFGGRQGGAVVMDIRTGELLVLASSPLYDLTDPGAAREAARANPDFRPFLSRATQDSVPSGSVIKPIVALAAGLNGVSPSTTYTCVGYIDVSGTRFGCSGVHGMVDLREAIAESCNVYFFSIGKRIGADAICSMAGQLGFGQKTGVDLPYEWAGRLPTPAEGRWFIGSTLNLSIGQGDLSVTPLQVAVAMAAIANGGDVIRPTIVHRIDPEPDAETYVKPPSVVRHVALPREMLTAVRDGMRGTTQHGTARGEPRLAELKVACKTGTAETTDFSINHAWIAGYLPWDNPRYAFAVVLHRVPGHGGTEAGPPAAAILEQVLKTGSSD